MPEPYRYGRRVLLALLAIIALGLLVRLGHWSGLAGDDDARYLKYAHSMACAERLDEFDHAAARMTYEAALAGWMRLFGASIAACSTLNLVVFAATAVMLFFLTTSLSEEGSGPGLVAVFMYACLPADISLSTLAFPDPLMTMLALAAALLYMGILRETRLSRQVMLAILCGALLGLSFSVKELAFCAGVAMAAHLFFVTSKGRWSLLVSMILVGGALIFLLELGGFALWTGDPLYKFHTVAEAYHWGSAAPVVRPTIQRATYYFQGHPELWANYGIYRTIIVLAVLLAVSRRSRASGFPFIWCAAFILYLSVGSSSLTCYQALPLQTRYLLPVVVMGCAIVGTEFFHAGRLLKIKPSLVAVAAAFLAGVSLLAVSNCPRTTGLLAAGDYLEHLDQAARERLVVPAELLAALPLDRQIDAADYAQVDWRILKSEDLFDVLDGRGVLVPDKCWFTPTYQKAVAKSKGQFNVEKLYGPAWPPYKRWLYIGGQKDRIGCIWWPKIEKTENQQ